MLNTLFTTISGVINLYCLICVVAIFMTWIPGIKFTSFGKFISAITDPYLNLFSRIRFLRIQNIDFSPIIAIGLLSLFSSIFAYIAQTGRIFLGGIIASIIYMIWNLFSTIGTVITIVMLIRWIVLLVKHNQIPYNSPWNQIDMFLEKISFKMVRIFYRKPVKYVTSLLICWILFTVLLSLGNFGINKLLSLCFKMPF